MQGIDLSANADNSFMNGYMYQTENDPSRVHRTSPRSKTHAGCNCMHMKNTFHHANHAQRDIWDIFLDCATAQHPSSKHHKLTWNLGLFLILSPYLYRITGSGHIASAMNASSEFPHPYPSVAYIFCPAKGSRAPTRERRTVFAARAEAA